MDPTANLRQQLELARRIVYACEHDVEGGTEDVAPLGGELAELAMALHEWMSKGGFPPEQWVRDSLSEEGERT